jgi:AcrR family transcriptional regulator
METIAIDAAVSKQTVYVHFASKDALFMQIVLDTVGQTVDSMTKRAAGILRREGGVEQELIQLAENLIMSIWAPRVLELRRLVIGEAARFPELGAAYFNRGFCGGLDTLADSLRELAERGELRLDDPREAAEHLAGLVLWVPMNLAMFTGDDTLPPADEVTRIATSGVRVFLAAYRAA